MFQNEIKPNDMCLFLTKCFTYIIHCFQCVVLPLALKWFNIQRFQVDPIDFRHQSRHQSRVVPTPFMSVIGVDHI